MKLQISGTLKKFIGERYIFTNPSFYTVIEEFDGILVLGDLQHVRNDKYRYTVPPSPKLPP